MRIAKYMLLSAVVIVIVAFFTYTEAGAVANGDGVCQAAEVATGDCAVFGATNFIEFLGAENGVCTLASAAQVQCTVYFYRYTGATTNQINILIPKSVTQTMHEAGATGCSQFYTDLGGDPTTGFGIGLATFNVCRIAPTAASFPVIPPTNANMFLAVDRSSSGPLSWQVRYSSKSVFDAALNGPAVPGSQFAPVPLAESQLAAGGKCEVNFILDTLGNRIGLTTDTPGCTVTVGPVFIDGFELRDNRGQSGITHGNGTCTTYGPPTPSPSWTICSK